eukprot:09473.XXX_603286_603420_1 [CDS] Oithona nana genome sequencing.
MCPTSLKTIGSSRSSTLHSEEQYKKLVIHASHATLVSAPHKNPE